MEKVLEKVLIIKTFDELKDFYLFCKTEKSLQDLWNEKIKSIDFSKSDKSSRTYALDTMRYVYILKCLEKHIKENS
ncbi:hypothetical protein ACFL0U_01455 [Pseudomonadota bacterium]